MSTETSAPLTEYPDQDASPFRADLIDVINALKKWLADGDQDDLRAAELLLESRRDPSGSREYSEQELVDAIPYVCSLPLDERPKNIQTFILMAFGPDDEDYHIPDQQLEDTQETIYPNRDHSQHDEIIRAYETGDVATILRIMRENHDEPSMVALSAAHYALTVVQPGAALSTSLKQAMHDTAENLTVRIQPSDTLPVPDLQLLIASAEASEHEELLRRLRTVIPTVNFSAHSKHNIDQCRKDLLAQIDDAEAKLAA